MKPKDGELTCEHCGEQVDALKEFAYRYICNDIRVPDGAGKYEPSGGGGYDLTGEWDTEWSNEVCLGRMFYWPCCDREIEDRELLRELFHDLPGIPTPEFVDGTIKGIVIIDKEVRDATHSGSRTR